MGKNRNELIRQPITRFIFTEYQDIYYRCRKILFETCEPQTFELRMVRIDKPPFWVRLDMTLTENGSRS